MNVAVRPIFKITFDENIVKHDLNKKITIYRYADNAEIQAFTMNSPYVSVSSNVLTVNANHIQLDLDTEYYVLVEGGAVANSSNGAVFAGISSPSEWNMRTSAVVDNVNPTLQSQSSALCALYGSCNVKLPITGSLSFTFSEPVYAASGFITLSSTTDNRSIAVSSQEIVGSGTRTITITPNQVLQPSTQYTVSIPHGAIVDAAGNNYAGNSWQLNTDKSPVELRSTTPTNNASGVAVSDNLTLSFDKIVSASSSKRVMIRKVANNDIVFNELANSPRISIAGSKVTIDPLVDLEPNTNYYITVEPGAFYATGRVNDIYYGMSNATDWRFQTGHATDTVPPVITTYSPASGSNNVGVNENIILTFSEPVYAKNGTLEIREYNSNAIYRSIDITSARITGGGTNQLSIEPHSAKGGEAAKTFAINTRYYVTISNQALVDVAGNAFSGITGKNYSFVVSSQQTGTGPQLTALSPSNLSTTVATTNEKFKLTFDKPVQVNQHSSAATIYSVSSRSTDVTAVLTVDPKDSKVVNLTPA